MNKKQQLLIKRKNNKPRTLQVKIAMLEYIEQLTGLAMNVAPNALSDYNKQSLSSEDFLEAEDAVYNMLSDEKYLLSHVGEFNDKFEQYAALVDAQAFEGLVSAVNQVARERLSEIRDDYKAKLHGAEYSDLLQALLKLRIPLFAYNELSNDLEWEEIFKPSIAFGDTLKAFSWSDLNKISEQILAKLGIAKPKGKPNVLYVIPTAQETYISVTAEQMMVDDKLFIWFQKGEVPEMLDGYNEIGSDEFIATPFGFGWLLK